MRAGVRAGADLVSARRRRSFQHMAWSERLLLATPVVWLTLFFVAPFLIVLKISVSQAALSQPPYTPVFDLAGPLSATTEKLGELGLHAYTALAHDSLYLDACVASLWLAGLATLLTLCVAYPFAFAMSRAPQSARPVLVGLAMAPFWTSFLIRVYAWIAILKDEGWLNHALQALGLIEEPLHILATNAAVLIGIVYSYLPFMILPLYNSLTRQEAALAEAAADLGASPLTTFWRVTFPLSRPGILAGCLLVFIPAVGEFVIPDLLGGSDTLMIGRVMWTEFFENRDWPTASAVSIVLMALLLGPLALFERARLRREAAA